MHTLCAEGRMDGGSPLTYVSGGLAEERGRHGLFPGGNEMNNAKSGKIVQYGPEID